jgi:glycosyltransferase involved in cell wall biosynthesis
MSGLSPIGSMHVHIVTSFKDAMRGSELRALELYRGLSRRGPVSLWSTGPIDPRLSAYPIRTINAYARAFPHRGLLLIVGVYPALGEWVRHAAPERVVVVYNTFSPQTFPVFRERLKSLGIANPEIVYAATWLMETCDLPGVVERSFIDLVRFRPPAGPRPQRPFTVGRLSRDDPTKFFAGDDRLMHDLAADGCAVRLMGATCLAPTLGSVPGVSLLPENTEPANAFLHSLDCFYYRTSEEWLEAFGRVVLEAMACALPVVAHWRGGYAEWIDDGENGFLIESPEEAKAVIDRLRADPALRTAVGAAARRKTETLFSNDAWERALDFYTPRAPVEPLPTGDPAARPGA